VDEVVCNRGDPAPAQSRALGASGGDALRPRSGSSWSGWDRGVRRGAGGDVGALSGAAAW